MEKVYEVQLLNKNYKIKVACSNAIDELLIIQGHFVLVNSDGYRVASLMTSVSDVSVSIWNAGTDGVYHNQMDVNITSKNSIQITKIMPDGSERRTDVDIVI